MERRTKMIVLGVSALFVAAAVLLVRHIDGPRIVARAVTDDGTEFCVVQRCNWDLEFFTTSCYYRKPGGRWGWFYYDHEDWYWGRGHAEVDEALKRISIFRNGRTTATFDWESERFELRRGDFSWRVMKGAQEWMSPEWNIAQR